MSAEGKMPMSGRLIAGVLLILVGVLFTLDAFGLIRAGDVFDYWPVILIGAGLAKIFGARRVEQRVGGGVLVLIGALFLLRELNLFSFRLRDLWPVLLLVVGASLVWQALRRRSAPEVLAENPGSRALEGMRAGLEVTEGLRGGPVEAGAVLSEFAFMGGGDRIVRSQEFQGGEVTAIMGGFKIDLRGASIAGSTATIEVFTVWGGVELQVPEAWSVAVHGTPILGMFSNLAQTAQGQVPAKTLVVRGMAIMGGVEVKN